jgi:UPF0716 protein FxsA
MRLILTLALVAFPLAEIALLIAVGDAIGVAATLALLVLAFVAGIALIRVQGFAALVNVRGALARGEAPTDALFQGACMVAAGVLLAAPGFLSDIMALALIGLVPFRSLVKAWLWRRLPARPGHPGRPRPGQVIDGEFETVEEPVPPRGAASLGRSPWARRDGPADAEPDGP